MKENRMLKTIAKIVKHNAYSQAEAPSRFWTHQPKTPAKLLEKKAK